jgi:hypothetical protein
VAVMVTPGNTAPDSSVTVPETAATRTCAWATPTGMNISKTISDAHRILLMLPPV